MPEGDTIHRTAFNLRKVLDGEAIRSARGRHEIPDAESLAGTTVMGIEARGKHLMIHFDDDRVLHSHMGMTGSWHIYRLADEWQRPERQAAIVLKTGRWCVVCFNPKLIGLVTERTLLRDNHLQRLGPDLLGPPVDPRTIVARFRTQDSVAIGEAVMNQTVVSGIGNVYKSEVLFLEAINPQIPVGRLSDQQILNIVDRAASLMRSNLGGQMRRTRFRESGARVWVYGRRNESCFTCGALIEMIRQGDLARSTYFCPECQRHISQTERRR